MKCKVTYKEVTTKTLEIEGVDIFDVMGLAQSYAEAPSEKIDFEKNPDDYEVCVVKIKEV